MTHGQLTSHTTFQIAAMMGLQVLLSSNGFDVVQGGVTLASSPKMTGIRGTLVEMATEFYEVAA